MARFKRGDKVVIVERETTAADRKSGLYYPHFRGLQGVVDQIYEEEGEVCVEVDQESLQPDFAKRHKAIESGARQKWLNSISEQERRSLSDEQKQLRLKYTVMVAPDDLAPAGRGRAARPAQSAQSAAESRSTPAAAPPAAARPAPARPAPVPSGTRRPGEAELAAQEEAHLAELLRRAGKES